MIRDPSSRWGTFVNVVAIGEKIVGVGNRILAGETEFLVASAADGLQSTRFPLGAETMLRRCCRGRCPRVRVGMRNATRVVLDSSLISVRPAMMMCCGHWDRPICITRFNRSWRLGKRPIDASSDLYSSGATLYAMLTGRPPLEGRNRRETIQLIEVEKPVHPAAACAGGFSGMTPVSNEIGA